MTINIKRRTLLSAAAAASVSLPAAAVSSAKTNIPAKWDVTAEVLVVGSGGAGLSAAVSAAEKGAKVTVIEKLGFPGGNTLISSGYFNCCDPERQKPQNIEDSVEKHIEQTLAAGDGRADPELVKILCSQGLDTLHWLEGMGLKFRPTVMQVYGALWPRSHLATEPKGSGFIRVLKERAEKLNVRFIMNTKLVRIIREGFCSGRVLGIEAVQNGKTVYIRAAKAVVLAAGGFAASPRLRALHDPRMLTLTTTNNSACSTGEVMLAANEAGAYLLGCDYIQCNPGCPPGHTKRQALHLDVARYVFVSQQGKRFVSEDARRDVLRDAILNLPEKYGFAIVDSDGFNSYNEVVRDDARAGLESGDAFTADTLEELAAKTKIPADELKKTIAEYNTFVDQKKDPVFGKEPRNLTHKIEKPPFWASLSGMAVHHTMGGVRINTKAQVVDREGNVIPGLYAAGEVTGGIHGSNRVGGNAILEIHVFGRLAGKEAASG